MDEAIEFDFPSDPGVRPVSSCQSAATGWLMNSGTGPSRTHLMHPMLVTPQAQQLQSHFVKAIASLYIYHTFTTSQSPFQYSLTFIWKETKKQGLITGPLIFNIISTVSNPTWPPGNVAICTGMEFTGAGHSKLFKKQTYHDFPPVWLRVMVFKQRHVRSYWNQHWVW